MGGITCKVNAKRMNWRQMKVSWSKVKLLRDVTLDFNGKTKRCKEEQNVVVPMKQFLEEAEKCLFKFCEYDFVAKW